MNDFQFRLQCTAASDGLFIPICAAARLKLPDTVADVLSASVLELLVWYYSSSTVLYYTRTSSTTVVVLVQLVLLLPVALPLVLPVMVTVALPVALPVPVALPGRVRLPVALAGQGYSTSCCCNEGNVKSNLNLKSNLNSPSHWQSLPVPLTVSLSAASVAQRQGCHPHCQWQAASGLPVYISAESALSRY